MKKSSPINKLIIIILGILFSVQIFFTYNSLKGLFSKKESAPQSSGASALIPDINNKIVEKIQNLKEYPFFLELREDWQHANPLKKIE